MLVVLALAFWLRLYDLGGQSLWSEEGLFLMRGSQPAGLTLAGELEISGEIIPDNVGPLPPLLLNLFQTLTGGGLVTGRLLSVLFGVLAISFLFQLGRLALDRRIALGAAFLLAISPYHVWLSREIGYEAVLFALSLVAAYAIYSFLYCSPRTRVRAAYLALSVAGLLLVLAALPRWPVDPALTFLFIPSRAFITHAAGLLGTGLAPGLGQQWWRYLPAIILAAAGVIAGWRKNRRGLFFVLLYFFLLLLPMGWAAQQSRAANSLRLVFLALPPFLLLVAQGWLHPWQKWRGRALALGVVLVAIQFWWLGQQYAAPTQHKDDVRTLAAELTELARPGDAIVIQDTGTLAAFTQSYRGTAPWFLLPAHTEKEAQNAAAQFTALGDSAVRVWLVTAPRPRTGFPAEALVEAAAAWPHLFSRAYDWLWLPLEVSLYAPRPEATKIPADWTPADINWQDELILEAYTLPAQVTSGGLWQPRFAWRKTGAAAGQYTLFLRLTDSAGNTWAVRDWLLWEDYPPGFWPEETMVRYEPVLRFPAGLPPGAYTATLQVVRTRDGQLLSHTGGTDLMLAPDLQVEVAVAPAGLDALPAYTARPESFGGQLNLLGYDMPTQVDYRPGHPIPVTLVWQAEQTPQENVRLRLDLKDLSGQVVNTVETALIAADYPPVQWPAGVLLAATHDLLVPATVDGGRYTVHISVLPEEGDRPIRAGGLLGDDSVLLTDVTVIPWPLETDFPPIPQPVRADFGPAPAQELHGYGLDPAQPLPGQPFELTLYWRAATPTDAGYTVLVHVTDAAGNLVAQGDGIPVNGTRPTTSWRPGEVLVDEHVVGLPDSLPAGTYTIWTGFYDPETGRRLPVKQDGAEWPDGRLPLGKFVVE